jgi:hypothetical protein
VITNETNTTGIEWLSPVDGGTQVMINVAFLFATGHSEVISLPIEYSAVARLIIELLAIQENRE